MPVGAGVCVDAGVGVETGPDIGLDVGADAGAAVAGRLLEVAGTGCACGLSGVDVMALSGLSR